MTPPNADHDFLRELMTVFAAEAVDRLAAIDRGMLQLEASDDADERAEVLRDLLRELHTLKGSTGAVDMPDVSHLANALETLMSNVDVATSVDSNLLDLADDGLRVMREMIDDHVAGHEPRHAVDAVIASLTWDPGAAIASPGVAERSQPVEAAPLPTEPDDPVETDSRERPARAASPASGAQPSDDTVRLATSKLDALMSRVGELVATRQAIQGRKDELGVVRSDVARLESEWRTLGRAANGTQAGASDLPVEVAELLRRWDERLPGIRRSLEELQAAVEGDERRLTEVTADIEDEVRRTRMLPVSTVVDPLHRIVRDLCRDLGKEVRLDIEGVLTEVDRSVLEHLRGPLTHLVRNAVDHGIEHPGARESAGKPRQGTIRIAAMERAGTLVLSIADDGGGIDVAAIAASAVQKGIVSDEAVRAMPERDVLRLVMRSGFSTRAAVTEISGRGVGLDAVRDAVERMNGSVAIASEPGVGTTFTLNLPLSVASTHCLFVSVGAHRFALPIGPIAQIVPVGPEDIGRAQGREMLRLDDGPVVVTRLEELLQLSSEGSERVRRSAVVLGEEERRFALVVDELHGALDVVVKPLPRPLTRVRYAAGATVTGDGTAVIVLSTADLVRGAIRSVVRAERPAVDGPAARAATVLVVDDSIVTRMLEKNILEAAGYCVCVAADGGEAWRVLGEQPVDVVVSDVNMPVLDGLALTARIRADANLKDTPVVLVTSLDAPDDQARGMQVGADAYIVKSDFSQDGLLDAVARLVRAG